MSFDDKLKEQIQSLPAHELTEDRRMRVLARARDQRFGRGRSRGHFERFRRWKQTALTVGAAVLVLGAVVGGTMYYHKQRAIRRINSMFTETEAGPGGSVIPTPVDTPQFRKMLVDFFAYHSSSNSSSSVTVPAGSSSSSGTTAGSEQSSATGPNGALSTSKAASSISHLVIRWSEIKGNYAFVFCTYLKHNQKHVADVIAQKAANGNWELVMKSMSPDITITAQSLLRYTFNKYFQHIGYGGGLPNRKNQFMWWSGVVPDFAITQIVITLQSGQRVTVPVKDHAYSYVQLQPQSGTTYGLRNIQGYNAKGKLIHSFN
ncbi:hypothetical protein [Alicyclobacillus sp. SO9]|uniref:hypothetical protein n=1 Tax=Alicyclobacillus sp. SO9 TaxID=2665646 RepID=UPI0018E7B68C|nr:hypothetical protein [Alicyclobacillus sp. SO9]QQE77200.1 hypothetical protein GI364_14630 [Alicyclobacillus sp. SO9]